MMVTLAVAVLAAAPAAPHHTLSLDGLEAVAFDLYCSAAVTRHAVVVLPDAATDDARLERFLAPLAEKLTVVVLKNVRGERASARLEQFLVAFARRRQAQELCHHDLETFGLLGFGGAAQLALLVSPLVSAALVVEPGDPAGFSGPAGPRELPVYTGSGACSAPSVELARSFAAGARRGQVKHTELTLAHCDALLAMPGCAAGCDEASREPALLKTVIVDHFWIHLLSESPPARAAPATVSSPPRPHDPGRERRSGHAAQVNLTLLIGIAPWRQTPAGVQGPGFVLGLRPEAFAPFSHVGIGVFGEVSGAVGRDLVLGFGPAVVVTAGHDLNHGSWSDPRNIGVTLLPGFYTRYENGGWQPGFSAGLAVRWADRYGVGVDARFGFGNAPERAVVVTAQADLLLALWGATARLFGGGGWIM